MKKKFLQPKGANLKKTIIIRNIHITKIAQSTINSIYYIRKRIFYGMKSIGRWNGLVIERWKSTIKD